ncbi:MAG: hypothetical protein AB7R89_32255 [Dehalococcoidia bacterium]
MNAVDELRERICTRPTDEVLARREKQIQQIRALQVSIAPLMVVDLRQQARAEEESSYDHDSGVDS